LLEDLQRDLAPLSVRKGKPRRSDLLDVPLEALAEGL